MIRWMRNRSNGIWLIPISLVLCTGIYYIPPVHSRLAWRLELARTQIKYLIRPPDKAVFLPAQQPRNESVVNAMTTASLQASLMPNASATPAPAPTSIPTAIATPLPVSLSLEGVKYEDQHGHQNYCGPANFSMALTFWGWDGNREVIGKVVQPMEKDKNAMPYEFQDYIADNIPGMTSVIRNGGDIEILKRLVSAGFPVVTEKGIYEVDINGKYSWMGHYAFVTGYDESKGLIIYQDSYQPDPQKNPGPNRKIDYETFIEGWRAFNYVFVVIYPLEKQNEVLTLLGPLAENEQANRHALDIAGAESQSLTGIDLFYAWFNAGTSHVALYEYADAASAYDFAFSVYADLDANELRPYRMMWYQTGPYKAYFYTDRFADVINLADTTLNVTISEPILEESLYWRGQANYMAGKTELAIKDYRAALKVHPKWIPATEALQDLGIQI